MTGAVSVTNQDILNAVNRLEDKVDDRFRLQDAKIEKVDGKVESTNYRLAQIEGGMSLIKWLGPTSIAAIVIGLAKAGGLI